MLAKVAGSDQETYWCLMDVDGKIHEIPEKMQELLNKRDWTAIESRVYRTQNLV